MAKLGPLPDAANVLRVKQTGVANGAPWMNGYYWQYAGAPPNSNSVVSFCSAFVAAWNTHLKSAFHSTVILENTEAWDLSNRNGAYGNDTTDVAGTRTGSPLPVNVAVVASWDINYRYKGGHPRTYYVAGVQGDIANGREWTSAARTAFETGLLSFLSAVNAIQVNSQAGHLICLRYQQTVDGVPVYIDPPMKLDIVDVHVGLRIDSQRRRLGKELS